MWKSCLQNVRNVSLVSSRLSTWGILLKLVVCARTPTRLRLYVPGQNWPGLKNCSNSLHLQITMCSTFSITLILPVLSDRGTGVLRKMQHLQICANYCATRLYWSCQLLRSHSWLIPMHVNMQLVVFCCRNMMMAYTPLRTIVAGTLRWNAIMGGWERAVGDLLGVLQVAMLHWWHTNYPLYQPQTMVAYIYVTLP